jgi:UDP-N-acetylmuramoyl-L-alanyl-D-glutamate--2,6-diaminopimelate ligase
MPFVIGTLTGTRTTPEPIELQSLLADAVEAGHTHCVMEVSSHAMTLQRVNGIIFDVCGFTNLGHDHLDFHGTMEAYFAAKASLFAPDRCRIAVVNTDDPYGAALSGNPGVAHVDVRSGSLADVQVGAAAVSFRWRGHPCSARAGGVFSVPNLHLALEVCAALGEDPAALAEATRSVEAPAGRFESVATGGDYDVVVDYAHTPEALSGLLASARALATGRVIVVFGCGGDRDAAKRPEMGRVSAELADVVIITSDNPRSEDPARIIAEIVAGAKSGTARVMTEENRADAIASAISGAGSGDIVVIAGKGHESHQEVNGRSLRFSDVETARDAVRRKAGNP